MVPGNVHSAHSLFPLLRARAFRPSPRRRRRASPRASAAVRRTARCVDHAPLSVESLGLRAAGCGSWQSLTPHCPTRTTLWLWLRLASLARMSRLARPSLGAPSPRRTRAKPRRRARTTGLPTRTRPRSPQRLWRTTATRRCAATRTVPRKRPRSPPRPSVLAPYARTEEEVKGAGRQARLQRLRGA